MGKQLKQRYLKKLGAYPAPDNTRQGFHLDFRWTGRMVAALACLEVRPPSINADVAPSFRSSGWQKRGGPELSRVRVGKRGEALPKEGLPCV